MLSTVHAKLNITFREGYATLAALPIVDYSQNEEFDSTQIAFEIKKNYRPINHVICLGQGELAARTVLNLFADAEGNISHTQSLFGLEEVTGIYENVNAESDDELETGGIEMLETAWNSDEIKTSFDNTNDVTYDIGDIVGARENITGIYAAQAINKKIVTLKNDRETISYEVGE